MRGPSVLQAEEGDHRHTPVGRDKALAPPGSKIRLRNHNNREGGTRPWAHVVERGYSAPALARWYWALGSPAAAENPMPTSAKRNKTPGSPGKGKGLHTHLRGEKRDHRSTCKIHTTLYLPWRGGMVPGLSRLRKGTLHPPWWKGIRPQTSWWEVGTPYLSLHERMDLWVLLAKGRDSAPTQAGKEETLGLSG